MLVFRVSIGVASGATSLLYFVFIDTLMTPVPVILILGPILLPIITTPGVDPVHLGVVMVLNLIIDLPTPPVVSCLYGPARIALIPFSRVVRAIVPYYPVLFIVLLFITCASSPAHLRPFCFSRV